MKKTFFVFALASCIMQYSHAQLYIAGDSLVRTIEVTGFATLTEKPDVVIVNVEITDEYCASPTENIDWLTDKYEDALRKLGIDKSKSKLVSEKSNELGYTNVNKRTQMVTRNYELKLDNYAMYYSLQSQLPARGIYAAVADISYSGEDDLQNKVRTMAVKDAHSKATTLVNAAGAKLGKIITLEEHNLNDDSYGWGFYPEAATGRYEIDPNTGEERYIAPSTNEEIIVYCSVRAVYAITD